MFNVGTLKTLSYLTSFGLLGGIGYTLYDYYENGQHETYFDRDRAKSILDGVKEPVPVVARGLSYTDDIDPAIVNANWTGAPPPPPPVEKAVEETGPVEAPVIPVDDILDVIGIFAASDDPSSSRCLIRMVDSNTPDNADIWLHIGEDLPEPHSDIAIQSIKPEKVTFAFADDQREPESIMPHARERTTMIVHADDIGEATATVPSRIGTSVAATVSAAPTRTVKRKGQYYIGTEDAETFSNNFDQILSRDVSSETHYDKDGKRDGIKLTSVAAGSIAAQHGAQSGDIIRSINGHPVSSKSEAIAWAKKNSDQYDVWQVEVENLGRIRTETFHSPGN